MIGRFVERGQSWRSHRCSAAGTGLREPGLAPDYPDPRRLAIGIVFFLVLGCLLRIVRYAQNLPLWSDECFLAVNFIRRGYAELLQPLDNGQIAPVLFLWAERLVIDLVGFSESGLRLFALLCGLASVFFFCRFAVDVLGSRTLPALLAIGVFAVSLHPIRHAAEAKPYASDLLMALTLLVPAARWLRGREASGWLWVLLAVTPLALLMSNPAIFVAGGVGLGLLLPVWKTRQWLCRLALVSFGLACITVFFFQYLTIGHVQSASAMDGLRQYWATSFPPLAQPWQLPGWLVWAHTGSTFAYPGGGAQGASAATFVAFVAGAIVLARRGQGAIVGCVIGPFGLAFLAAALGRYPYGSEARLMQFAAPGICLLAGQGAAAAMELIASLRVRRGVIWLGLSGLVACGIGPQVLSFLHPYRMLYDHQEREFARSFWAREATGAELACAHLDYGLDQAGSWQGHSAWYLCNQMIYSPARRARKSSSGNAISAVHPLRCVVFDASDASPVVREWLTRMQRGLKLRDTKTVQPSATVGEGIPATEHWKVYEFVPRSGRVGAQVAGGNEKFARSVER
jgi:hypothetical protein